MILARNLNKITLKNFDIKFGKILFIKSGNCFVNFPTTYPCIKKIECCSTLYVLALIFHNVLKLAIKLAACKIWKHFLVKQIFDNASNHAFYIKLNLFLNVSKSFRNFKNGLVISLKIIGPKLKKIQNFVANFSPCVPPSVSTH